MAAQAIFQRANLTEHLQTIVDLAQVIWREHYTPIIGEAQVEYMLSHVHSRDTIANELQDRRVHYYLIESAGSPVGYICVKLEEASLFLSKIYVMSSQRGGGLGRLSMQLVENIAREHELNTIRLTVNRDNSASIAAYQRLGFAITGELCADIGQGYVMDDYTMELQLTGEG